MDPVIAISLRCALALLLLDAARHKLRDPRAFHAAVSGYALLPPCLVGPAATGLVGAELAIGSALLASGLHASGLLPSGLVGVGAPGWAALGAAGLLALYGVAIGVNLARGRRDVDCGCAGPGVRQSLHGGLLARNALLCLAALVCTIGIEVRALEALDVVTAIGATLSLAALYGCAQRLLALAPLLVPEEG